MPKLRRLDASGNTVDVHAGEEVMWRDAHLSAPPARPGASLTLGVTVISAS